MTLYFLIVVSHILTLSLVLVLAIALVFDLWVASKLGVTPNPEVF